MNNFPYCTFFYNIIFKDKIIFLYWIYYNLTNPVLLDSIFLVFVFAIINNADTNTLRDNFYSHQYLQTKWQRINQMLTNV